MSEIIEAEKNTLNDTNGIITIKPLTAHIGAEISGIDLKEKLNPEQVKAIYAALLKWKVIFFKNQHLDHQQHVEFSRQFGQLTIGHPVFGYVEGHPEIYSIARHRKANSFEGKRLLRPWTGWHADVTAAINPPYASILRGVVIPPYAGDTQWTNLVAAYNGLSQPLRGFIDTLFGEHRFTPPEGAKAQHEYLQSLKDSPLASEHPLVRVHPETGERALYVSPSFIKKIVGLTPRESDQLLHLLLEHAVRPEYTVRFKWEAGDIAFWDNRSTAHLPPSDIFDTDFERQLYRTTLVGDIPVSTDGRQSRALEGTPVLAHTVE